MSAYKHLKIDDRKVIQKMRWGGKSYSEIGRKLKKDPKTIKNEIARNKCKDGFYRAIEAQAKADERHHRKGFSQIDSNLELKLYIIEKVLKGWSPEYIAGRLQHDFPENSSIKISYESIYKWIYKEYFDNDILLWKYLPRKHKKRKQRHLKKTSRVVIKDKKSIHDRPEEVNLKNEIGHWEGDTVVGKNNDGYIVTMLERVSQLYLTAWMPNKDAENCQRAMSEAMADIPNELIKTITFDNGTEFANFKNMEELFECDIYFADSYSSWQRGSNERSNGLLRRFFPKKTSFKNLNLKTLEIITKKINNMPRKMNNYLSPIEVFFNNSVALHH